MGFLKHLLIETKVFVLSSEGGKSFRIIERSRKVKKEMVLSHASVRWFANTMEECSLLKGRRESARFIAMVTRHFSLIGVLMLLGVI